MPPDFTDQDLGGIQLIETLGRDRNGHFPRMELHLDRLRGSAARLGWNCDPKAVQDMLQTLPPGESPLRVRLTLDSVGQLQMQYAVCPPTPKKWRLALAKQRLDSRDLWLTIKSTRRTAYDQARAALPKGIDEILFLNERDELCEGTITNLFIQREGRILTPPPRSGLLPGVLRRHLLDSGKAIESILYAADLHRAEAVFVGNSLRGLIPAELAFQSV